MNERDTSEVVVQQFSEAVRLFLEWMSQETIATNRGKFPRGWQSDGNLLLLKDEEIETRRLLN